MGPSADDEVFDDAALRRMSEGLAQVFHTDCEQTAPVAMQGAYGPHLVPGLPRKVLEEAADQQVVQDEEGNVVRLYKGDATRSMPQWLRYPMQGRSDWETIIRPRLGAAAPGGRRKDRRWTSTPARSQIETMRWGCGAARSTAGRGVSWASSASASVVRRPGPDPRDVRAYRRFRDRDPETDPCQGPLRFRDGLGGHGRQGGTALLAGHVSPLHAPAAAAGDGIPARTGDRAYHRR